jgi:cytochrome P450
MWPGAGSSTLAALGERVVVDLPLLPTLLFTSSVADARALLIDADDTFSFGQVLQRFTAHDVIFGLDSFLFLDGAEHRVERKLASPPFHGRAVKSNEELIAAVAREHLERWPVGRTIEFLDISHQLSIDVIMAVVFGTDKAERNTDLKRAMHAWLHAVENPVFHGFSALGAITGGHALPFFPVQWHASAVDKLLIEEIGRRRAEQGGSGDGAIMHILRANVDRRDPKDDAALAREIRGIFFAGYATTAVTLAWIAEFVSHSPRVLTQLLRGIDEGDDSYLDAVIFEVMRLRPAVPVTGRRALQDTVLNGLRLPKGTVVVIPLLAVHERADIYDDPQEFRPERFLDARPGTYTWLPFGAGAHRCLGAGLATLELRVIFRTLLQQRTFQPLSGPPARPRLIHPVLAPVNNAKVVLQYR